MFYEIVTKWIATACIGELLFTKCRLGSVKMDKIMDTYLRHKLCILQF